MPHPTVPYEAEVTPAGASRRLLGALLSVVLPAHNEAQVIRETIQAIVHALQVHTQHWEILVVDDGSRDDTCAVVQSLPAAWRVHLIRLSRNFGKEAALTAGLDRAKGQVVITMDADGQHPTDLLTPMLQHWSEGIDMVYAVRNDRASENPFKRYGTRWFYLALSAGGEVAIPQDAGDFRLMDRCVVDALKRLPERSRFMKGLYAWVGFRTLGLPYTPLPRQHGTSHYSKYKLIKLALTGITGFSALPLRISSALGFLLASVALCYGVAVLVDHLFFSVSIPGWPTIVVSIMFFSGVQLLFIGVLGEYLARVYYEVKGRPTYLIAEVSPPADQGSGH